MVAGHLREKSGYYYAVLNYTDSLGKRKTKWISTGLTVKGNKKRAEAILMDARRNFNPEEPKVMNGDILFADYNPIQDGETIDGVADGQMCREIQWKCQYEDALIQPPRAVLDINMGEHAAGNRD